jgi:hypothetical protein
MISVLTAFFLYSADASWGWWVLFGLMLGWQAFVAFLAIIVAVNK